MIIKKKVLKKENELIIKLNQIIDKLDEYILLKENRRRFIVGNFIGGITRGFGISIGIIIFGAITLMILKNLVTLPLIGKYIAEIVNFVDLYLQQKT